MPRVVVALFLFVVVAVAPIRGALAKPKASGKNKAAAKKLAADAKRDYTLGRFAKALATYSAAYEQYPAPGLLFNIGQCHSKMKNWTMAIFSYQAYLRERPKARNRPVVEELLSDARAAIKARAAAKKRAEKNRESERQDDADRAKGRALFGSTTRSTPASPVYKKWWFWGAVGAVVTSGAILFATSGTTTVLPERSLGVLDRR